MLLKILLKIWPALIPILLYLLWILAKKLAKNNLEKKNYIDGEFQEVNSKKVDENEQNKKQIEEIGDFSLKNRKFIVIIYLSLFLIIISFLLFAITPQDNKPRAQLPIYEINIKNHTFYPNMIEVAKDQKFKLVVNNLDDTSEKIESKIIREGKVIEGNSKTMFLIEIEKAGNYEFYGEFHKNTANGIIVAE